MPPRRRTGTAQSSTDKTPEVETQQGQTHRKQNSTPGSSNRKSAVRHDDSGDSRHKFTGEDGAGAHATFATLFGFRFGELTSPEGVVRLLCRPSDPASLGALRVMYGVLMLIDTFGERGMTFADRRWGDPLECRFPLFDFLSPLPLPWMYVLYVFMLIGAVGILLGYTFRLSCVIYLGPYWYIFFLDKTHWNNHSYLFGIMAALFALSDANRYWSVDALLKPRLNNQQIPLWNYAIIRSQLFVLYFIAGLKKLDADWTSGYSMQNLSYHWVFDPLKLVLTEPQIDMYIVHLGGLCIDLSVGFLMFFDKTRPLGLLISSSFHLMNSQLFNIGMFPYLCLASQIVFCDFDWPRRWFRLVPSSLRLFTPEDNLDLQFNPHCVYTTTAGGGQLEDSVSVKDSDSDRSCADVINSTEPQPVHKLATVFTILFVMLQGFLPYSHGITKGYNNWTNGLYGYSWDMMIHSWSTQHIRITYIDKDTGESGYLDPSAWAKPNSNRWSGHGDMVKQRTHCIAQNLRSYNINNVEIYFDIWRSLNSRFQQRFIDPNVDIMTAEWSPLTETAWVMPLLTDLSDWRGRMEEIQAQYNSTDTSMQLVFIADFPGMHLENYIHADFDNTSLQVLDGRVLVELLDEARNISVGPGETVQIPANTFHNVHTVSSIPSCYMYIYVNTTEKLFLENFYKFEAEMNSTSSKNETLKRYSGDPFLQHYQDVLDARAKADLKKNTNFWQNFKSFLLIKYRALKRSMKISSGALYCLITNGNFSNFLHDVYQTENTGQNYPDIFAD